MRHVALCLVLVCVGCAIQRAQVAGEAQHQMVGMSKQSVLACMGPPPGRQAEGATEVWAYPSGGRTDSFATAQTYGSGVGTYNGYTAGGATNGTYAGTGSATSYGFGTSVNRYCVVNIVFSGDTVAAVNYQGNTGGLLTQGEECAYAIRSCIGQPVAAPPPTPPGAATTATSAGTPSSSAISSGSQSALMGSPPGNTYLAALDQNTVYPITAVTHFRMSSFSEKQWTYQTTVIVSDGQQTLHATESASGIVSSRAEGDGFAVTQMVVGDQSQSDQTQTQGQFFTAASITSRE